MSRRNTNQIVKWTRQLLRNWILPDRLAKQITKLPWCHAPKYQSKLDVMLMSDETRVKCNYKARVIAARRPQWHHSQALKLSQKRHGGIPEWWGPGRSNRRSRHTNHTYWVMPTNIMLNKKITILKRWAQMTKRNLPQSITMTTDIIVQNINMGLQDHWPWAVICEWELFPSVLIMIPRSIFTSNINS